MHIYIDGILYRTYEVDFAEESYRQLRDYTEEFLDKYVPGQYAENYEPEESGDE